jgi:hypothetical protein
MSARVSRPLIDVVNDARRDIKAALNLSDKQFDSMMQQIRAKMLAQNLNFARGMHFETADNVWLDYEVQRNVIIKHLIDILKKFDIRIIEPAATANFIGKALTKEPWRKDKLFAYNGQHRCILLCLLGYTSVPVIINDTDDLAFPSVAFVINNHSGIKKVGKPDLHQNWLYQHKLGLSTNETELAFNVQKAFDNANVRLLESSKAKSISDYWFSHFDYAYKSASTDKTAATTKQILDAITISWPADQEIDQGVFIGLYYMNSIIKGLNKKMPKNWMQDVTEKCAISFTSSHDCHDAAKRQWQYYVGSAWSAPQGMYKFMREVYMTNGGKIVIPSENLDIGVLAKTWCEPNLLPQVAIDSLNLQGSEKTFLAIQHGNTVDGKKFLEMKA